MLLPLKEQVDKFRDVRNINNKKIPDRYMTKWTMHAASQNLGNQKHLKFWKRERRYSDYEKCTLQFFNHHGLNWKKKHGKTHGEIFWEKSFFSFILMTLKFLDVLLAWLITVVFITDVFYDCLMQMELRIVSKVNVSATAVQRPLISKHYPFSRQLGFMHIIHATQQQVYSKRKRAAHHSCSFTQE